MSCPIGYNRVPSP